MQIRFVTFLLIPPFVAALSQKRGVTVISTASLQEEPGTPGEFEKRQKARQDGFTKAMDKVMDMRETKPLRSLPNDLQPHEVVKHKYYLLNLKKNHARLAKFTKNMRHSMLNNTCRIDAVLGKGLTAKDFAAGEPLHGRIETWRLHKGRNGWGDWDGLNDGAIGCFLSHTLAWDQMEKDDVDIGFVMEDDVTRWSSTFDQDVKKLILSKDPRTWDVILMSHCDGAMGNNAHLAHGGTACTGMMAVSKYAIPKMRKQLFPIRKAIDSDLNLKLGYGLKGFNLLRTVPKMGDQQWMGTDVQINFKEMGGNLEPGVMYEIPDCK